MYRYFRIQLTNKPGIPGWMGVIGLMGILGLWGVNSAASVRSSATYEITLDSTAIQGGKGESTSYRETDSSVGQESPCGLSTSSRYRMVGGVVQPWDTLGVSPSGIIVR